MTVIENQQPAPFAIPDGLESLVESLRANGLSDDDIKKTLEDSAPVQETGGPQPAEEDGGDSNILGNIGAGIVQGIDKGTENILSAIPLPEGAMTDDDGNPITNLLGFAEYYDKKMGLQFKYSGVDEGSISGGITKGVTQALVGIIPATKFLKVMGVGNRIVRGIVGGAVGDFATSSEEEAQNLLKLIDMIPQEHGGEVADNVVGALREWLIDPDSGDFDELKSRILNTAPGIVIGLGLEGTMRLALAAKEAGPEAIKGFTNTLSSRLRGVEDSGDDIGEQAAKPTDAASRVSARISTDGGPVAKSSTLSELYRIAVDKLDPLKRAVDQLSRGMELPAGANPYKLARLNVASASKANLFLESEVRSFKTGEVVGRSLRDVLKPVARDGKALNGFRTYATARRALELMRRTDNTSPPAVAKGVRVKAADRDNFGQVVSVKGKKLSRTAKVKFINKETGTQAVIELPVKALTTYSDDFVETGFTRSDVEKVVADGNAQFSQIFDDVVEYQDNVLQYLADSGVVSKKMLAAIKEGNKDYVPFFRLMGDDVPAGSLAGLRNPIKKIKGSERDIVDPLESIIKNTYLYVQMADRNQVLSALHKMAGKAGDKNSIVRVAKTGMKPIKVENRELQKVLKNYSDELGVKINEDELTIFRPQTSQVGPNQVPVFVKGKRVILEMDKDIADAIKGMDDTSVNILFRMVKAPAVTLRMGAILDPEFFAKNMVRDNLTAAVFSNNGFRPFVDFFSGMTSLWSKDKAYKDWLFGGGAQATFVSLDRTYMRESLKELTETSGLMGAAKNVIKSPLEMLKITTEIFENSTRIGEFKLAQKALAKQGITGKEAMQEAAFDAREVTLDFARMGSATRGVNLISAFFNARLQGYDRLVRAFAKNPAKATKLAAATITLPSTLFWLRNHDDPRYQELPQWQKDMFWIWLTEDNVYRIPKPFELGIVFGTLPEHALEAASKAGGWRKFPEKAFAALKQDILAAAIPTIATPVLEHRQNHSFFRGRPVVPESLQGVLPEDQFKLHTNEISKTIAKALGSIAPLGDTGFDSPIIVENYIRQWTGGLGKKMLDLAESGLKKAGIYDNRIEPTRTLADINIVKGFVVRYPSTNLNSIENFYKKATKAEKIMNSLAIREDRLDFEGMILLMQNEGLMTSDSVHRTVRDYKQTIREQRRLIELIYLNNEMTPDEKRENIDFALTAMLAIAQQGDKMLDDFNEAQKKWKKVKPEK